MASSSSSIYSVRFCLFPFFLFFLFLWFFLSFFAFWFIDFFHRFDVLLCFSIFMSFIPCLSYISIIDTPGLHLPLDSLEHQRRPDSPRSGLYDQLRLLCPKKYVFLGSRSITILLDYYDGCLRALVPVATTTSFLFDCCLALRAYFCLVRVRMWWYDDYLLCSCILHYLL